MTAEEYCGHVEFSILRFIFSFTDDVREKIAKEELFYQEQIVRYAEKQVDLFFRALGVNGAILHVYKNEAFNTIMFKIKNLLKEHNIFRCI